MIFIAAETIVMQKVDLAKSARPGVKQWPEEHAVSPSPFPRVGGRDQLILPPLHSQMSRLVTAVGHDPAARCLARWGGVEPVLS